MSQSYQALELAFTRLYRYQHLAAIASWDQAAMMPEGGNEARAAAMAELAVLMHNTISAPELATHLTAAEREPLEARRAASVREMRRYWQLANVLPAELVEAKSLAGTRCEHAWRTQRKANDWQGFLENFRPVVRYAREEAARLSDALGVSKYEALMAKYEPGMTVAAVEQVFAELASALPALITAALAKQAAAPAQPPEGPFAVDAQRALGLAVMQVLQFDFKGGRLDVSTHPFCGGVPEDVRITTRYREDDFMQAMMGVVHETGHARYEQSLPRELIHLPVGQARSMGLHESQSLLFEMQLGRSSSFIRLIAPLVHHYLGQQPALAADNLVRLYNRVRPDFIRVDADELTYPAHVILRFEIERDLMEGRMEPDDIPAAWDAKMMQYLGVDTRGNYAQGCMQDIHWTDGSFGYFPSYTLGAMYAAQFFAAIRTQTPDLDAQIAKGNLNPIFTWLDQHIWKQASLVDTPTLVKQATGQALSPAPFLAHLRSRYVG